MNYKQLILGLFLIGIVLPGLAQPADGSRRDRIEALKIAYLTRELSLTSDEAKVFWPVYDQFQNERKALRKEARLEKVEAQMNFDEMSDKEVQGMLNEMVDNKQAELDLTRKYIGEFQKVLPVRKVAKLFQAELRFKNQLMERLQNGPQGGPDGQGPGQGRGFRRGPRP
ncbi:MAG: hypothetical protein H6581_21505 [Bacteroidia bacterium]|nr:hypothetical protein [Bacteroidia bacterium]